MKKTSALCLTLLAACGAARAADGQAPYTLSGHVDLVSRYDLRGVTTTYGNGAPLGNALADAPESDKPVLQWGADFAHDSGFYAGYWGSQINYSYKQLGRSYRDATITDFQTDKSIENDFYAGYGGSLGGLGYTAGLTYYHYINGVASNAPETKLGLSWGPLALSAQTLLRDTVWGNKGDTYWSALYTRELPWSLKFTASLGFYSYEKEGRYLGTTDTRDGSACAAGEAFVVNDCYAGNAPVSSGFRHLILGVSQPIASTPLTWGAQAIVGGKNRFGISQKDRFVLSLAYGF
ncbi:TorF family putative porin [Caldimonas tepidiphila]|uniref:TorF family putative porin n=1 Tax=Caldimonas tepidiphila TaxID=2315841 RepID=UPI000E5C41FA|nr:TorF family putative porin [Caldimonas tepidiphila]